MKKTMLYTGILYMLFGFVCLTIALTTTFKLESLLWGFAGTGICPGAIMIGKYFYCSSSKHQAEYERRLKKEAIDLTDERKIMLRDRSGRIAYSAMLLLQLVLVFLFSILSILDYFSPFSKYACIGLGLLLIIQYLFGIAAYNRLSKTL